MVRIRISFRLVATVFLSEYSSLDSRIIHVKSLLYCGSRTRSGDCQMFCRNDRSRKVKNNYTMAFATVGELLSVDNVIFGRVLSHKSGVL